MTSVLRRQGDLSAVHRPTVGDLKMSLVGVDHVGWLFCDGRQIPISAFQQLFDVMGYSFGTDVSAGYFRLPNPQGRVLGMVGQTTGTSYWSMGDVSGEEVHTLTVEEMPTHNHDYAGGARDVSGNTSYEKTDITMDASGQHNHGGSTSGLIGGNSIVNATENVYNSLSPLNAVVNAGEGSHNHIISSDGLHSHKLNDPTHRHMIAPNGGDQPHNNIQPTLWVGNLFVYSGRLFRDVCNGNWFPPQGPPINVN